MAKTLEESILESEVRLENYKSKRKHYDEKVKNEESILDNLKKEKQLEKWSVVKQSFSSDEDLDLFIKAIESKDMEAIKKLLS